MANDNYYVVSGETLSQFAEALRALDGTSQPLEWFNGFAGALWSIAGKMVDIQPLNVTQNGTYTAPTGSAYSPVTVNVAGSGGTDYLAALLNNTLTTYSNSDVTSIPQQIFRGCTQLQSVSFPNVTSIGEYAFYSCANLASASFTNVTTIGDYGFYGCSSLTSAPTDKVTSIGTYAFGGCSSLTSVSLPKYTLSKALPTSCFRNCTNLANAELPVDYSGDINSYCFGECTSLEVIDLQKAKSIAADCFNGSSSLTTIVLRRTSKATLSNISAFTGTPFASGGSGGTLYVPQDIIANYQRANNWSTILGYANNQIKKIEGSEYE